MIGTDTGAKNILKVVYKIQLEEIKNQILGYFGLRVIGNVVAPLPIHLAVSALTHLSYVTQIKAVEIKNSFNRVRSDMISKAIEWYIFKNLSGNLGLIVIYMNGQILGGS